MKPSTFRVASAALLVGIAPALFVTGVAQAAPKADSPGRGNGAAASSLHGFDQAPGQQKKLEAPSDGTSAGGTGVASAPDGGSGHAASTEGTASPGGKSYVVTIDDVPDNDDHGEAVGDSFTVGITVTNNSPHQRLTALNLTLDDSNETTSVKVEAVDCPDECSGFNISSVPDRVSLRATPTSGIAPHGGSVKLEVKLVMVGASAVQVDNDTLSVVAVGKQANGFHGGGNALAGAQATTHPFKLFASTLCTGSCELNGDGVSATVDGGGTSSLAFTGTAACGQGSARSVARVMPLPDETVIGDHSGKLVSLTWDGSFVHDQAHLFYVGEKSEEAPLGDLYTDPDELSESHEFQWPVCMVAPYDLLTVTDWSGDVPQIAVLSKSSLEAPAILPPCPAVVDNVEFPCVQSLTWVPTTSEWPDLRAEVAVPQNSADPKFF